MKLSAIVYLALFLPLTAGAIEPDNKAKGGEQADPVGNDAYVSFDHEDPFKEENELKAALIGEFKKRPVAQQAYDAYIKRPEGGSMSMDQYLEAAGGGGFGTVTSLIVSPKRFEEVFGLDSNKVSSDPEAELIREMWTRKRELRSEQLQKDPYIKSIYSTYQQNGGKIEFSVYALLWDQWLRQHGPTTSFYRDERNIGKKWDDPDYEHPVIFEQFLQTFEEQARAMVAKEAASKEATTRP